MFQPHMYALAHHFLRALSSGIPSVLEYKSSLPAESLDGNCDDEDDWNEEAGEMCEGYNDFSGDY